MSLFNIILSKFIALYKNVNYVRGLVHKMVNFWGIYLIRFLFFSFKKWYNIKNSQGGYMTLKKLIKRENSDHFYYLDLFDFRHYGISKLCRKEVN